MKFLPSKLVLLLLCNCGVVPQILGQEETTPSTNVPLVNSADIDESMLEEAQSISLAFRKVAQKTLPATVKVIVHPNNESMDSTKSPLSLGDLANNFSPQDSIEGGGSGFIVDPSGVIVTNNHVLAQSDVGKRITIELNDGRQFNAKEIYHDEKGDLAVVTIEASEPLPSLTFAETKRFSYSTLSSEIPCAFSRVSQSGRAESEPGRELPFLIFAAESSIT